MLQFKFQSLQFKFQSLAGHHILTTHVSTRDGENEKRKKLENRVGSTAAKLQGYAHVHVADLLAGAS